MILSDFILGKFEAVLHYDRIQAKYPNLTEDTIQTYLDELKETGELIIERTVIFFAATAIVAA